MVLLLIGVNVDSPQTWLQLLQWDPAMKLAPAVVSTLLLMLVMSHFRSPWALPAVLIFIPGVFFLVLACLHKSLAQAQDGGWVARPQASLAYMMLHDACRCVGSTEQLCSMTVHDALCLLCAAGVFARVQPTMKDW